MEIQNRKARHNYFIKEEYECGIVLKGTEIKAIRDGSCNIEDSYGNDVHNEGYYTMNDNYFEDFVLEVIIDKKYLSEDELELFNQEPIMIEQRDLL